jgi:cyclophilin family peptidyl-prolyl cis-trans isomerase
MMKRIAVAVLFLAVTAPVLAEAEGVALQQIDTFIEESKIDTTKDSWRTDLPKPNVVMYEKGADYFAVMETNKGTIRIKLLSLTAPMHATSFIYLARLGFYDGLSFHRVITGFMAQGGCPLGTGTGGPGYKYDGEFDPSVKHDRPGLLSMANAGPGTDGSQFFLTFVPTPHLNGKHTIFGEVTDGMDVVKTLEASGSSSGTPSEKLVMTKVTIEVE